MDKSWIFFFLLLKYLSLPALRVSKLLQLLFSASVRIQQLMNPTLSKPFTSQAVRQVAKLVSSKKFIPSESV